MGETPKFSMHKKHEAATRKYYGADKDPLRFVPAVKDKDTAHEIALQVDEALSKITEEDIAESALRAQARYRRDQEPDIEALKREALDDRLRHVVVNTEITHARLAPGDFNEDSERAGAYEMGIGYVLPDTTKPPESS